MILDDSIEYHVNQNEKSEMHAPMGLSLFEMHYQFARDIIYIMLDNMPSRYIQKNSMST
jgi:hypothetical protein